MNVYVKKVFQDKHTQEIYQAGTIIEVTDERFSEIAEHLGADYVAKVTFEEIVPVKEDSADDPVDAFPKHAGGGYYELSDGSKIQGKKAAVEAEAGLASQE